MTKSKSKRNGRMGPGGTPNGPRPFQANVVIPYHLRFTSTSAGTYNVSAFSLNAACGAMSDGGTSAYPFLSNVKLSKVEVWAPSGDTNTASTVSVIWGSGGGTTYVSGQEVSDTSCNVSKPAHVVAAPPSKSLASDWVQCATNTQVLFSLTVPVGVVVDVWCVGVLADNAAGTAITIAAGPAVGIVAYQPLDGDGGSLLPVGKTKFS